MAGLLRSDDGGAPGSASPSPATRTSTTSPPTPDDPDLLYVSLGTASLLHREGEHGGVARSRDGGRTWEKVETDYTRASLVPAARPDLLIAGPAPRVGAEGRIVVSADGGDSWEPAGDGIDVPMPDMVELFVDAPGRRGVGDLLPRPPAARDARRVDRGRPALPPDADVTVEVGGVRMTTSRLAGVDVPRIGLGTNRLTTGHVAFVRDAVAAGVRHIDTAHLYTGGESERAIGEALDGARRGRARRDQGRLPRRRGPAGGAGEQIEQSLRSLRTEAIGLYYLHRVDPETPLEESLGAIKAYVDRGAIRHVGVSEVSIEQIERARQVVPIAAVQNQLQPRRPRARRRRRLLRARGDRVRAVLPAARAPARTRSKLAWLLQRSPVVLPIPGTLSIEHLRENLAVLTTPHNHERARERRDRDRRGGGHERAEPPAAGRAARAAVVVQRGEADEHAEPQEPGS